MSLPADAAIRRRKLSAPASSSAPSSSKRQASSPPSETSSTPSKRAKHDDPPPEILFAFSQDCDHCCTYRLPCSVRSGQSSCEECRSRNGFCTFLGRDRAGIVRSPLGEPLLLFNRVGHSIRKGLSPFERAEAEGYARDIEACPYFASFNQSFAQLLVLRQRLVDYEPSLSLPTEYRLPAEDVPTGKLALNLLLPELPTPACVEEEEQQASASSSAVPAGGDDDDEVEIVDDPVPAAKTRSKAPVARPARLAFPSVLDHSVLAIRDEVRRIRARLRRDQRQLTALQAQETELTHVPFGEYHNAHVSRFSED